LHEFTEKAADPTGEKERFSNTAKQAENLWYSSGPQAESRNFEENKEKYISLFYCVVMC